MKSRKTERLLLVWLQMTGVLVSSIQVREKCSKMIRTTTSNDGGYSTAISLDHVPLRFPMKIKFSHPVKHVELSPASVTFQNASHTELILNHIDQAQVQNLAGNIFMKVFHDQESVSVESIKIGDEILCEEIPSPLPSCGSHGSIDNRPEEVVRVTAAWATGANYLINIASYPDFVGYRIDIFFSAPVRNIEFFKESSKKRQVTPLHWVLLGESTEKACKKLIHLGLTLEFDNAPQIESLMLNGNAVYGVPRQTGMLEKNSVDDAAITRNCGDFLTNLGIPWFGMERARLLLFSTSFRPQRKFGIVVDFVFEEPIKELRTWRFKIQNVSGDEWRVDNPGWQWNSRKPFKLDVIFSFFNHYHVNLTGIQVNGEVLCGLAIPTRILVVGNHVDASGESQFQDEALSLSNSLAIASLVLVTCLVASTAAAFVYILIKVMKLAREKRRAFYGSIGNYPVLEHTYATVNEPATKEETAN